MKNPRKMLTMFVIALLVGITMVWATGGTNSVSEIPAKNAGDGVSAQEFNSIVDTMRGIYNYFDGTNHFFGLNNAPTAGITLDLNGAMQLGNFAGFPATAVAGTLFFNTTDSRFYYYNGSDWRPLDTADCSSCPSGETAYEYTCTDESGDSTGSGVWNGGTVECNPANYDANIEYDDNLGTNSRPTTTCADSLPDDATCTVSSGLGVKLCEPIVEQYETRCGYTDWQGNFVNDGNVYWYNDCGKNTFNQVATCTSGCTEIPYLDGAGQTVRLSDGTGVSPMHPQYTSGAACGTDEMGCETGYNWIDPYPKDNYEHLADWSFFDSPRYENVKFAGICDGGPDPSLGCGIAADSPFSEDFGLVRSNVGIPAEQLCIGGTASKVYDGWTEEAKGGGGGSDLGAAETGWLRNFAKLLPESRFLMAAFPGGGNESCDVNDPNNPCVLKECTDGTMVNVGQPCPAVGSSWHWYCTDGTNTIACETPHLDWIIGEWSNTCVGGWKSREVYCTDTPNMTTCVGGKGACYSLQDCLDAGAGNGTGFLKMYEQGGSVYSNAAYNSFGPNLDSTPPATQKSCGDYECLNIPNNSVRCDSMTLSSDVEATLFGRCVF